MKAPKKTKARWERQLREAQNALSDIAAVEREKLAKAILGKCFRYSNSYGHGSQWWLYGRVIGTDEHGWLRMFEFETTDHQEMQIRTSRQLTHMSGWVPIATNIFEEEWEAFRSCIGALDAASKRRGRPKAA